MPPITSTSTRCLLSSNNASPVPVRERLSRSISLSLSLKSPGLETVPHSCSPSPDHLLQNPFGFGLDEVDGSTRPMTADLSPTTALARLTFEAMDTQAGPDEEVKESSSYVLVSRRKHTREESYRSLRQRLSTSSSTSSSESHYYSTKQKTETSSRSSSSMVLTVSQSQRVTSSCPLAGLASLNQWKPPPSPNLIPTDPASSASHCSEISVQIEESATAGDPVDEDEPEVEIRRRGPGFPRPHSDGGYRHMPSHHHHHHHHHPLHHTRSVPRRPSYAPSETCSSINSDEMLLPSTPSSPPPSHCLLSPQVSYTTLNYHFLFSFENDLVLSITNF